jgi:integrase
LLKNLRIPVKDSQLILGHAHASTTQQLYEHGGYYWPNESAHRAR